MSICLIVQFLIFDHMKKKVLLVLENSPFALGGIERHCSNIIDLFYNDKDISVSFLAKEDVKYKYIRGINKVLFSKSDLCDKIESSGADIIHIHGFASLIVPQVIDCAYKLGKKIVYTAHFHPFRTLDNPNLGKLFFHLLLKPHLSKIDTIIAINQEDYEFFQRYNENVIMMPHWINTESKELPLVSRVKNMLLYIGRTDANKGVDYLYSLPNDKYEIHCVSKGIFNRTDFIIHNNISDQELEELYLKASVVLIPSKYEAFSYVALEALQRGTPIVISDNVRIKDYLDKMKGKGVAVFPYGNTKLFLENIETVKNEVVDVDLVTEIFNKNNIRRDLKRIYINDF